jgi:hypothetical protein
LLGQPAPPICSTNSAASPWSRKVLRSTAETIKLMTSDHLGTRVGCARRRPIHKPLDLGLVPDLNHYRSCPVRNGAIAKCTMVGLGFRRPLLIPLILGYTAWAYWVFRGKVRAGSGYH